MGVGRAAAPLWGAICAALGLLGPAVPWSAAALALLTAALAVALRARAPLAAALLALGAAPAWTAAAVLGAAGEPTGLVLLAGAVSLLALGGGALPRALALGLVGLGALLALRQLAAGLALPAAASSAPGLALAGLALGGLVSGARPAPACLLGLALLGLGGGLRAGLAAARPPADEAGLEEAARLGVLRMHQEALAARPELGLRAIALDPEDHGLALRLLPRVGEDALLVAGWRPEGAPLAPERRLALAARLEARGEGGRAIRLLRPGRADPRVAWTLELYRRQVGEGSAWAGPAPAEVLALPGATTLDWGFLANGERALDWHAERPLRALRLELIGTPLDGAPTLEVRLDDGAPRVVEAPARPSWVEVSGPLGAGPHRLRVRFDNDRADERGDRNAWVLGLAGEEAY